MLVCRGDSLSYHLCNPDSGGKSSVQTAVGDSCRVVNRGVGSESSTEIAARRGASNLSINVANNTIPATADPAVQIIVNSPSSLFLIFTSDVGRRTSNASTAAR